MEKLMDYDFVQSFQRQVYDDNFLKIVQMVL